MSHTLTMRTTLTSLPALQAACSRLGLEAPKWVEKLVIGSYDKGVTGYAVHLKVTGSERSWLKPVVFDLGEGDPAKAAVYYDNWEGRWGEIDRLYELESTCAQESIRLLAAETGQTLTETVEDGNLVFLLEDAS